MSVAADWARVSARFTETVDGVAADRWDDAAPCEGWRARDVVGHLVEWVPAFLESGTDVDIAAGADVEEDPAAAWRHLDAAIQEILDDPAVSTRRFDHPRAGSHPLDDAIATFVLSDVLVHTWDLARATGQDETLDPDLVGTLLVEMEPMADVLAQSGQYAPRVPVAADADPQTRLIALSGRDPAWHL